MKPILYNYFRDYDPSTGRYIQADPIGILEDYSSLMSTANFLQERNEFDAGLAIELNRLYQYVQNNPQVFWDDFGLVRKRKPSKRLPPFQQCQNTVILAEALATAFGGIGAHVAKGFFTKGAFVVGTTAVIPAGGALSSAVCSCLLEK